MHTACTVALGLCNVRCFLTEATLIIMSLFHPCICCSSPDLNSICGHLPANFIFHYCALSEGRVAASHLQTSTFLPSWSLDRPLSVAPGPRVPGTHCPLFSLVPHALRSQQTFIFSIASPGVGSALYHTLVPVTPLGDPCWEAHTRMTGRQQCTTNHQNQLGTLK